MSNKSVTLFLIVFAVLLGMPSTASSQEPPKDLREVEFFVSMTCMGCVERITDRLMNLRGVEEVQADLSTKIVRIKYRWRKIDEAALEKELQKLGYVTKKIIR